MNQIDETKYSKEIIIKIDNMLRNCPLDMMYFNIIFTDSEIILDFLNRSFRTWLLRIKPYKVLKYEGINVDTIKNRHENNIVIKYDDINKVKFSNRTFLKNAYIDINADGYDDNFRLFSRNKVDLKKYYEVLKKVLNDKIEFNK